MNRWVLLEHKVYQGNSYHIHYDFLVEDQIDCLTWKFLEIPTLKKNLVEIIRQPNHRLVWLSRLEHELSFNRGLVKRIDCGTYVNLCLKLDTHELKLILDGHLLNGLCELSGNTLRLTKKN